MRDILDLLAWPFFASALVVGAGYVLYRIFGREVHHG